MPNSINQVPDSARYDRRISRSIAAAVQVELDQAEELGPMLDERPAISSSVGCQTDQFRIDILERKIEVLENENKELKEKIAKTIPLHEDNLNDDEKVKFYTGLPNIHILLTLFNLISPFVSRSNRSSLSLFQELVLTLCRLRLNLSFTDLGYRFGVSHQTASRIFDKWITMMASKLSFLIRWPTREELWKTMPNCFRKSYGTKVVGIIDCFEVFIERPRHLLARACTWSQYKHHHTSKFLINVTPQGTVSFLSKAWGGRTSDQHVTEQCGLLKKILPGDVLLADRGFNIKESVAVHGGRLEIPEFTKGREQLPAICVEETRKIANCRIHVERVIGLVRQKFQILSGIISMDALVCDDGEPQIDKIATVCCALTNLCDSVVGSN